MTRLASKYTVIAPDMLGHGFSDKPRADYSVAAFANGVRDLLWVLGHERVTVVGHSLGGGVAMQFCYQYPSMVSRLVLVSTGGVTREVSPPCASPLYRGRVRRWRYCAFLGPCRQSIWRPAPWPPAPRCLVLRVALAQSPPARPDRSPAHPARSEPA